MILVGKLLMKLALHQRTYIMLQIILSGTLKQSEKQGTYMGQRIERGLFRSKSGRLINADINGACNILRKVVPNAFADGVEGVVVRPLKVSFL